MAVRAVKVKAGISPAGNDLSRITGFTLLELLVVMALAAILMTLVPPMISSSLPGVQLKSAARELAAGLRYARSHALTSHETAALTLDVKKRNFQISGRQKHYSIPDSLHINLLTAESETRGEYVGAIRFFPDGGSTGGRITLSQGERAFGVDVDWLTGRVRILDLEPES
ncbi:MAG TPA: type II secretion system protein GspH [Thiolapillus brandeum]|uniref:Type II secretion system protein H n=1 Tax=Thiolapillus brandeum TaxID=1076588 RepID=A0A831K3P8_9GAMM|nr:type II secretion system protein GspH [Thiolapillus brandeum]